MLQIIDTATAAGIRLEAEGGKLIVEFGGEVPDAIVAGLKQYKFEIIALLRQAA